MTDRTTRRVWIGTLAIATLAAYSSALKAPFEFDDHPSIRKNASIRQLLPLSVPLHPPANTSVAGRPVVNVTLAANYAINDALGVDQDGPDGTTGYHVLNVCMHVLCGVFLFAVIGRTLRHRLGEDRSLDPTFVAGFATLLWLVHPIQTEAVDYVIQRTELIVSACYLATLYASIRAWDAGAPARRWWYVLGVLTCALGMGSKEVMVTAPLMVVLYDRAFRSDSWKALLRDRARVGFYAMLFATTLIVAATVADTVRGRSVGFGLGVTWYQYLYTQAWAIPHYLRLLAWPNALTFDYGEAPISGLTGVPGLLLLAACGVATVLAWTRKRWIWLGFLGAWFFLILAPSSSVVPIRTEIAAERRVYLASAALFVLLLIGVERLRRRAGAGERLGHAGLGAIAVVLAIATFVRGTTYADAEILYRDVIAKAPANPRGYIGAGLAMFQGSSPRFGEAAALLRQATSVDSTSFVAWHTLGLLEFVQGDLPSAKESFGHALRLQPDNLDAIDGMARTTVGLKDPDAAMPWVDRLGTVDQDLLWSFAALLVERGRGTEAVGYLEEAVEKDRRALGLALLSMAYAQGKCIKDAVREAGAATAAAGDTAAVFVVAGRAMVIAKHTNEARTYLNRALALDPANDSARRALAALEASER